MKNHQNCNVLEEICWVAPGKAGTPSPCKGYYTTLRAKTQHLVECYEKVNFPPGNRILLAEKVWCAIMISTK